MMVIRMSERELTRLRVLIDLSDRQLTVEAASSLMGLGRRQVYRLRRPFATGGTTGNRDAESHAALRPDDTDLGADASGARSCAQ
jgi:hypothetical protein